MKEDNEYTNEPLGYIRVIDDFLPPPEELVYKEDNVKVTLGFLCCTSAAKPINEPQGTVLED